MRVHVHACTQVTHVHALKNSEESTSTAIATRVAIAIAI